MASRSRLHIEYVIGGLLLLCLNLALIAFYALWKNADSQAINEMEAAVGYDPSYLLPNADPMWIAAHASLLLLFAIDALIVVLLLRNRARSRFASSTR